MDTSVGCRSGCLPAAADVLFGSPPTGSSVGYRAAWCVQADHAFFPEQPVRRRNSQCSETTRSPYAACTFIVRLDEGKHPADPLNLIVEVSGEPRRDKAAKVATARNLWVPAVNNDGRFGRWAFVEVTDPWDAKGTIVGATKSA